MSFEFLLKPEMALAKHQLLKCTESELAEDFLKLLLNAMSWAFRLDEHYRLNIKDFNAVYYFTSVDKSINVTVHYHDGHMDVKHEVVANYNIKITFKDDKALFQFILSGQDLLSPILNQSVMCEGNLNYLNKFGYLSKHLMHMFGL